MAGKKFRLFILGDNNNNNNHNNGDHYYIIHLTCNVSRHLSHLLRTAVFSLRFRSVFQTTWSLISVVCSRRSCRPPRVLPRQPGHQWTVWSPSCHSTHSVSPVWLVPTPVECGWPRDGTSCTWPGAALWVSRGSRTALVSTCCSRMEQDCVLNRCRSIL